jgi:hypothetical protein
MASSLIPLKNIQKKSDATAILRVNYFTSNQVPHAIPLISVNANPIKILAYD